MELFVRLDPGFAAFYRLQTTHETDLELVTSSKLSVCQEQFRTRIRGVASVGFTYHL